MKQIFSIGHSNRKWEDFMEILTPIKFDYLIDVRSIPYSRFFPHFNKNQIINKLGDKYIFMGNTLGGMDEEISDKDFMYGIEKIVSITKGNNIAFFCSEKDYKKCHRFWKITPELEKKGFKVIHL